MVRRMPAAKTPRSEAAPKTAKKAAAKKATAKKAATRRAPAAAGDDARAALVAAVRADIEAAAAEPIAAFIDPAAVRQVLSRADGLLFEAFVAEMIAVVGRRVRAELGRRRESPWELLDDELAGVVESLLDRDVALSNDAEDFVGRMMRRELIRDLLTDVVHTSIVSFNKKVNPLFGGFATSMLEGQIKSFIRLFMPLVQDQATSFLIDRRNQSAFSDFARAFVRELLDEPIPQLLGLVGSRVPADEGALARSLAGSRRLRDLGREISLAVWDDVWEAVRRRRLGEIVPIAEHVDWLAEHAASVILFGLSRPVLGAHLRQAITSL